LRDARIAGHAHRACRAVTGVIGMTFIAVRDTRGGARVMRESN